MEPIRRGKGSKNYERPIEFDVYFLPFSIRMTNTDMQRQSECHHAVHLLLGQNPVDARFVQELPVLLVPEHSLVRMPALR